MQITVEFLYKNYVVLKKSSEQIGHQIGMTGRNVRYYLEKLGFKEEMANRKRIINIGREPPNKGKPGKSPPNKGVFKKNPKNGRHYVYVNGKCMARSRYIMEKHLGRKLDGLNEVVHHIDGNSLNDSIENLQVISQSEHIKHHKPNRWKPKQD